MGGGGGGGRDDPEQGQISGNPGRQDYRKRKWGQTPGSSLRPGLSSSDQAQCQLSQYPAPYCVSTHLSLSAFPNRLPAFPPFPSPHLTYNSLSSTYLNFPGLSSSKELSPQGRERGKTKIKTLSLTPDYRVRTMAQAWPAVPGQDWEGIARNEKGEQEQEQCRMEKSKSWKVGAESWRVCQVLVGEGLRNRWVRRAK